MKRFYLETQRTNGSWRQFSSVIEGDEATAAAHLATMQNFLREHSLPADRARVHDLTDDELKSWIIQTNREKFDKYLGLLPLAMIEAIGGTEPGELRPGEDPDDIAMVRAAIIRDLGRDVRFQIVRREDGRIIDVRVVPSEKSL